MALYRILNDVAVRWYGEPINDVRHPLSIESKWSQQELEDVGLYKPAEADPIPEDKVSVGRTVQLVSGVVKWVHTLEDYVAPEVTSDDVNDERTRRIEQGSLFTVTGIAQQIRVTGRPEDMDTLLALVVTAQLRISQNDNTVTQYRDGNNVDHMLSPAQIIELWGQSMAWVERVYKASWDIKAMSPIPADYINRFDTLLGV